MLDHLPLTKWERFHGRKAQASTNECVPLISSRDLSVAPIASSQIQLRSARLLFKGMLEIDIPPARQDEEHERKGEELLLDKKIGKARKKAL